MLEPTKLFKMDTGSKSDDSDVQALVPIITLLWLIQLTALGPFHLTQRKASFFLFYVSISWREDHQRPFEVLMMPDH